MRDTLNSHTTIHLSIGKTAALASAAAVAAILLTKPVAELPFNDDWTYAFSALQLARTGRVLYNGWAAASAIAHIYWGGLLIRLFGFSFTLLRLGTIPFAAGAVWISVLLARSCGLSNRQAGFIGLLLGTSPLFLPLAASFMTDVPGLFFLLLSVHGLIRFAGTRESEPGPARESSRARYTWLAIGVLAGAIGGTDRQINWICPLVALPCLAFYLRDNRQRVLAAAGWVVTLMALYVSLTWFSRQPYARHELPIVDDLRIVAAHPGHFGLALVRLTLTVALVTLPVLWIVAICLFQRNTRRRDEARPGAFVALATILIAIVAAALYRRPDLLMFPWLPNTLTPLGVMGNDEIPGFRPVAIDVPMRFAIGAAVYLPLIVIAAAIGASALRGGVGKWLRRQFLFMTRPGPERLPMAVLILVSLAYSALVLTRLAQNRAYDRYALPLIVFVGIAALSRIGPDDETDWRGARRAGRVLLGLFALYAIASTQDLLALSRARVVAADRLMNAGIPRTRIQAGVEFDCWTELLQSGHVDPEIIPADMSLTPSLHPDYRVEFQTQYYTGPTSFGSVEYTSLLPPFRHSVQIDIFTLRAAGSSATVPTAPR